MTSAEPGSAPGNADDGGWVGVFVRRPILALVLNLLIIIAGIAAYQGIEVRELPDVDRPVVTVRATYAGATPESIDSQITAVIESAVSRVQGVTSISSNSSYGSARISIEFSSRTNRGHGRPRCRRRRCQSAAQGHGGRAPRREGRR